MKTLSLLPAVILTQGCVTYAAAGIGTVAVGSAVGAATSGSKPDPSAVRVRLSAPRDLVLVGQDTLTVREVRTIVGRMVATHGDTVTIAVSETDGASGRQTFGAGQRTTSLLRGSGVDVAVLSTRPRRKQWAVIGGIVAGISFVAATLIALSGMT